MGRRLRDGKLGWFANSHDNLISVAKRGGLRLGRCENVDSKSQVGNGIVDGVIRLHEHVETQIHVNEVWNLVSIHLSIDPSPGVPDPKNAENHVPWHCSLIAPSIMAVKNLSHYIPRCET